MSVSAATGVSTRGLRGSGAAPAILPPATGDIPGLLSNRRLLFLADARDAADVRARQGLGDGVVHGQRARPQRGGRHAPQPTRPQTQQRRTQRCEATNRITTTSLGCCVEPPSRGESRGWLGGHFWELIGNEMTMRILRLSVLQVPPAFQVKGIAYLQTKHSRLKLLWKSTWVVLSRWLQRRLCSVPFSTVQATAGFGVPTLRTRTDSTLEQKP